MASVAAEPPVSRELVVQRGSQTRTYFIPISGLQEGTHFRDVWVHLKQTVKRIQHIEVYPDSNKGWVCVTKLQNFTKAYNSLQQPILVAATGESRIIEISLENLWREITIRIPQRPSLYLLGILERAAAPQDRVPVSTGASPTVQEAAKPSIPCNNTIYTGANVPVIAHGTWFRDRGRPLVAEGTPAPVNQAPPRARRFYALHVSGFHPTTTIYQIRKMMHRVARECNMRHEPIGYNAVTVLIRDKSDALMMGDALNGRNFQGARLRAVRGQLSSL